MDEYLKIDSSWMSEKDLWERYKCAGSNLYSVLWIVIM